MERIGERYHLVVTGHSLGGALSTMFSFFASTDARFTANGPVKCFNFGAPYVGGYRFLKAFHHQEQTQKLQYARFFNHNDVVAHLPFNFRVTRVRICGKKTSCHRGTFAFSPLVFLTSFLIASVVWWEVSTVGNQYSITSSAVWNLGKNTRLASKRLLRQEGRLLAILLASNSRQFPAQDSTAPMALCGDAYVE